MNNYNKQLIKKVLDKVDKLSEEEIKENIKKYFGEEYLIQEETLSKLYPFQYSVTNILGTLPLPIIYETIEQDSMLDKKEECIIINQKYYDNLLESAKCIAHEQRHYYQLSLIAQFPNDPLTIRLKEEFENETKITDFNDDNQILNYQYQEKEIDTFAFTQVIISSYYHINTIHPDKQYQKIIDLYKQKYYK